ncbi:emp24/gp25L/p24 family/GOLD-domain-containing protein [Zopfochytrium polystomum]|nr:emp24/gp25L/p24 family/GOLD-domain-containing protein [Zopfochytrium polystomum]
MPHHHFHSMLTLIIPVLLLLSTSSAALKFDLYAGVGDGATRCVVRYIDQDTLVVGSFSVSSLESGQDLTVVIKDDSESANQYWKKVNVADGSQKFSFTPHRSAGVHFCFTNKIAEGYQPGPKQKKLINLHVDSGVYAEQIAGETTDKKLRPMERELMNLEQKSKVLLAELDGMRASEESMRDINESTNERIAWFSTLSMISLLGAAGWQVWYLRKFFQTKKIL